MKTLFLKRLLLGLSIIFQAGLVVKFMPTEWIFKKQNLVISNTYQEEKKILQEIKNKLENLGIKEHKIDVKNGIFSVYISEYTPEFKESFSKGILSHFLPLEYNFVLVKDMKINLEKIGDFSQGVKYKTLFPSKDDIKKIKGVFFKEEEFDVNGFNNEIIWYPNWDLILENEYRFDNVKIKKGVDEIFLGKSQGKYMFSFFKNIPQIEQKFQSDMVKVNYRDYFIKFDKFEEKSKFYNISSDVYNKWFLADKGIVEINIEDAELELPFIPEKIYTEQINLVFSFSKDLFEIVVDIPKIFYQQESKLVLPEKIKVELKLTSFDRRVFLENIMQNNIDLLLDGIKYSLNLGLEARRGDVYLKSVGNLNKNKPSGEVDMVIKNFDIISPPATRINSEQCDLMKMYLENVSVQVNDKEKDFLKTTACLPPEDVGIFKSIRKYLNTEKRILDDNNKTVDILNFKITEEDFKKEENDNGNAGNNR